MVRFQRRVSKKQYLNGKHVYEYQRISIGIPRKYHELLADCFDKDFDVSVKVEYGIVTVTLTSKNAKVF